MNKKDKILIFLVLAISIIILIVSDNNKTSIGQNVNVYVDGEIYESYLIYENSVNDILIDDNLNVLEISNGKAFMIDANCPDKYCINQGEIVDSEKTIVCLPHKLYVKIE